MKAGILDIADVARRSGLPASTLRYYEELGLIRSVGRHGLRRLFDAAVLDQLAFISLARLAGFSLKDISAMAAPGKGFAVDREKVRAKADEVALHIKRLKSLNDLLHHVADCPETDHFACPNFRKLLRLAQRQRPS